MSIFDIFGKKQNARNYQQELLQELDAIKTQFPMLSTLLEQDKSLISIHKEHQLANYFMQHSSSNPKLYLANMIVNQCESILKSGKQHSAKGVLNSKGMEIKRLLDAQMELRLSKKDIPQDRYDEFMKKLEQKISEGEPLQ